MGLEIAQNNLPLIEINEETISLRSTADQVCQALETYGCFLAKYDKLSPDLHHEMFKVSKDLFQLPKETKVKNTGKILGFGYGTNFPFMPLVEYISIENAATVDATKEFTNLMFPSGNDDFCDTAYTYSKLLSELDATVTRLVFSSYGVDESCYDLINSSFYCVRFLKYRTPDPEELNVGLHPHVDKDFLGVVDTNHVSGLELQMRNGEWISYYPSPTFSSIFIIIAGEPFQAWSNGRIFAPLHKVLMKGTEEKFSIAQFSFMSDKIRVPKELIDEQNPLKFKEFNHLEFLQYIQEEKRYHVERSIVPFCGV